MTDTSQRRRVLYAVGAVLVLQGLAAAVYLYVEHKRRAGENAVDKAPIAYERLRAGTALPVVDLQRRDGTMMSTRELHGRPVLLHFWATWCAPCREELPGLLALSREGSAARVVALADDDDWATVQHFFGGKVPSEVFREPSGVLAKHLAVRTLPDTYLLNAKGVATLHFGGARNWWSQEARDVIANQ